MSLLSTVTSATTLITSQAATITDLRNRPPVALTPEEQAALDALQAAVDANPVVAVPVTPTP